jgi:lipopolysaccharide export LptBFGC system permease protein LptF
MHQVKSNQFVSVVNEAYAVEFDNPRSHKRTPRFGSLQSAKEYLPNFWILRKGTSNNESENENENKNKNENDQSKNSLFDQTMFRSNHDDEVDPKNSIFDQTIFRSNEPSQDEFEVNPDQSKNSGESESLTPKLILISFSLAIF